MKISSNSFAQLKAAITPRDTEFWREKYRAGEFPRAERTRDVNKRYRWDLARSADVDFSALYDEGLHDTHIDTALRQIVPSLD